MTGKIDVAASATDEVQTIVSNALAVLNQGFSGRIVNGFGIYHEPFCRRRDLLAVIDEMKRALAIFDQTIWPNSSDYDTY